MLVLARPCDRVPQTLPTMGDFQIIGIGRMRVGPEWSSDHQPPYQSIAHTILLPLEGSAAVETQGVWQTMEPGRVAIIPGFQLLRRRTAGFTHAWINFASTSLARDLRLARTGRVVSLPLDATWERCLEPAGRIHRNLAATTAEDTALVEAALLLACTWLMAQAPAGDRPGHGRQSGEDDGLVRKAVHWIDGHYLERPSLEAMAAALGCSAGHLHACFSADIGLTPSDYAERQRLRDAQHLLTTTALPVQDIARRCGYDDPFHFSKVVRRYFGVPPKVLRANGTPLTREFLG